MAVELPEFITLDFFQKIFEEKFDKKLKVENFWGEFATKPGDNYASEMFRITVDYELDDEKIRKAIILKVMPSGLIQQKVMVNNQLYPREIHAYTQLLTEIYKLLELIGDDTKLAPQCHFTATEPKMMLMFEDMREKNYKVLPRQHQLNFEEAKPLIVKLAKLHATSAVLYEKNPSLMEPYIEGSISTNPNRQDFLVHYKNCTRTLGLVAENEWGDEWKEIAEKLKALEVTILKKSCELYIRDPNGFSVINHNDMWVPNFFFKFNEDGGVNDVLFIDYQMPHFNSPGIDLNFLFYGALNEETRIFEAKKLLRIYHEVLRVTLAALKYPKPIPTLHDIHVEVLKTGLNSLIASFCEVPLLMVEHSDDLNMDLLLGDSETAEKFRYTLFNNEKYKHFIQKLLIEFDDLGYLD